MVAGSGRSGIRRLQQRFLNQTELWDDLIVLVLISRVSIDSSILGFEIGASLALGLDVDSATLLSRYLRIFICKSI